MTNFDADATEDRASALLAKTAQQLQDVLEQVARSLRPFPSFLGMTSVQAVEVEPGLSATRDLGCVVVDPDGRLCSLEITAISGIAGMAEADQVEQFQPLDLSSEEYIVYASAAIALLSDELRRRGGKGT
ncbi:MAG: hypothetical protein OXN21_09420 [Chloroflexota bacterium]|nr:hypothetical protein [Chloroflexota bacterium]